MKNASIIRREAKWIGCVQATEEALICITLFIVVVLVMIVVVYRQQMEAESVEMAHDREQAYFFGVISPINS